MSSFVKSLDPLRSSWSGNTTSPPSGSDPSFERLPGLIDARMDEEERGRVTLGRRWA